MSDSTRSPGAGTPGPSPANPRGAPTWNNPVPPRGAAAPQPTPPPTKSPNLPARSSGAGARRGEHAQPRHVRTEHDGGALAAHLLSAQRSHPVLVVSTPHEDSPPLIDADDLHRRVGTFADVVVLHNGPASWAFADAMPNMTQVYGGAGRVYALDLAWVADPYKAPLRFCWPGDNPARVADTLEDDAYAAASVAGLLVAHTPAALLPASGKVKGFIGRHHAALWLDRGGQSLLLVDQLYPGIERERLLQPGQVLTGRIERGPAIPPFIPEPIHDDASARAAATYRPGDVVLARVTRVSAQAAQALLHPEVPIEIHAGEDEPDLRNLIAVEDVVTLWLVTTGAGGFAAEVADVAAPTVPCMPVLPGGPAWLRESDLPAPEPEPEADAEPEPVAETPAPTTTELAPAPADGSLADRAVGLTPATAGIHAQLASLQAQVTDLANRLDRERQEAARQTRAAAQARDEAKRLRRELRSMKDQHRDLRDRTDGVSAYADPETQLRHEVEQVWLYRIPEPERPLWPLQAYLLGPDFLDSLNALEGISRDKVLDVLVDVLTGRAKAITGRQMHPLRVSEASQVQQVREDGARGWRCAMQVNTPSARRLHFWRHPDGTIELGTVGVHDAGL